jgi:hypothetical protein
MPKNGLFGPNLVYTPRSRDRCLEEFHITAEGFLLVLRVILVSPQA